MIKAAFATLLISTFAGRLVAQQPVKDTGTYIIHKFAQAIGTEKFIITTSANGITGKVTFKYVDRGSLVSLKANVQLTPALQPVMFAIKGGTSRFSTVDDSIAVNSKVVFTRVNDSSYTLPLAAGNFPVAGYSPATQQMLLVKYWQKQGRPKSIQTLPTGNVQVSKDGADTLLLNGNKVMLQRYVVKGLIWGNELLWTDTKGQLLCLITNDAEGDKQEIVYQPYESLLPELLIRAATYGMRLFTNTAKPAFVKHNVTVIKGGTLVDVENNTTITDAVVIIENGIIKQAGAAGSVTVPANAFVIDAKGKTILPGLWDMHAHFEQAEWGPAYLAAGVTTVRDCGNEFEYINAIQQIIDAGKGVGPHILKAGVIDGKGPMALGVIQASAPEEARAEVQRYKQNGFVQIKIYSSVKPAIVKVICDEAHKQGLTVTGHIPIGMTIQQGVDSGMDMVNHVQYIASVLKRGNGGFNLDDSANQAVFAFLKAHNTVIDPTLGVFEIGYRSLKDSITTIEPAFSTVPLPMQPLFLNTGASDDSEVNRGKRVMKLFSQIVNQLNTDSITIVAGTDMNFPGLSLFRELELYVDAGLTPMQAIKTATITPAKVMRMQAKTGSIAAGKNADIIIVNGNPLQNIRSIRNVETVIKNGDVYSPLQLHRLAGFNE